MFYSDRVNRYKRCVFLRFVRQRAFITKTRTIILCLRTQLWIALALGEQLQGIFTSETMKRRTCWCTKAIMWELNSFPMKTLSLGLCYIFCVQKYRPAKWNYTFPPLVSSAESSVGFGRKEEGTQHAAKLQLFVRTKSRPHFMKTCLQGFLMPLTLTSNVK